MPNYYYKDQIYEVCSFCGEDPTDHDYACPVAIEHRREEREKLQSKNNDHRIELEV